METQNTELVKLIFIVIGLAVSLGGPNVTEIDIIKNIPGLKDGDKRKISGWVADSLSLLLPITVTALGVYLGQIEIAAGGTLSFATTRVFYWLKKTIPPTKIDYGFFPTLVNYKTQSEKVRDAKTIIDNLIEFEGGFADSEKKREAVNKAKESLDNAFLALGE